MSYMGISKAPAEVGALFWTCGKSGTRWGVNEPIPETTSPLVVMVVLVLAPFGAERLLVKPVRGVVPDETELPSTPVTSTRQV